MSLAHGRHYLAIPGPSVMPDRVLAAMHRPAPNIYFGELADMTAAMIPQLRAVARTSGDVAIYIANGHAVWEASLANVMAPGDQVLALVNGRFGAGWAAVAERGGAVVTRIDSGKEGPHDLARLRAALEADTDHAFRLVTTVHVDTATSVRNDIAAIRRILDETGHPALLMVDCVASLACDRFEMDAWGVDVMITASQKGLMTPPGLGFVFFNARAAEARARLGDRVSYTWDWVPRAHPDMFYQYFNGTAPTHHLFGLNEALSMIGEEGIEQVWARHDRLARAVWAAVEAWGKGGPMRLNIVDPEERARAVTSIYIGAEHGPRLRAWLTERMGVTLGIGLGMETEEDPSSFRFFRIAHMGHVNAHMVLGLLGTIQAGMVALDIPFGTGALDAAIAVCAEA